MCGPAARRGHPAARRLHGGDSGDVGDIGDIGGVGDMGGVGDIGVSGVSATRGDCGAYGDTDGVGVCRGGPVPIGVCLSPLGSVRPH